MCCRRDQNYPYIKEAHAISESIHIKHPDTSPALLWIDSFIINSDRSVRFFDIFIRKSYYRIIKCKKPRKIRFFYSAAILLYFV